ncbi:MAG: transporter substrate-binding domain-containing protein [Butyrivibrio sp.]|uniref:HD domain-containing phosphohydrolase n=1 Tax=Butyrivibrio sp. TaxID=28121 RepID=UPI0025FD2E95|nr:HD domain-containing phosphohydrolase [Butyrivibrio sp.]MCR5771352.1 transporter substrate-binding domain-containing protein [Butyrivibrio sp.]
MSQRVQKIYLFIFIIFFVSIFSYHSIESFADDKKTVRVGYYENEIFQEGASEGAVKSGYAYEYYRKLSEYTGWEYEYVYGTFSELYTQLVDGKIDLLAGIAKSDDRIGIIAYPDDAMGSEVYNLIKHDYDTNITSDPASFAGKKIGILNSVIVNVLNEYLSNRGVSAQIEIYDDYTSLFEDYDSGELDIAAVEGSGAYSRKASEVLCTFGTTDYYLCVNSKRADLLFELNKAQTMLSIEEPNYLSQLRNRYYSGSVSSLAFSYTEKDWLTGNDTLKVGYLEDFLPFCDTDASGNVTGIVKDIIPKIIDELNISGVSITYQGFKSYDDMLDAMNDKVIDLAFPVEGSLFYSEQNGIYQSSPLVTTNNELVYKGTYDSSLVKTLAVNKNCGLQYYYTMTEFPDAELVFYDSSDECIEAVQKDEVDGTVLNGLRAYNILRNSKYHGLSAMQLSGMEDICFGIEIGNKGLLKIINRGLSILDEDYVLYTASHYTDELFSYSVKDFLKDNAEICISFVIIAFIVILFILGMQSQQKIEEEKRQRYSIQKIFNQMIMAFAKMIDKKDEYTSGHSFRVADYSRKLARKIGYTEAMAQRVYNVALLHDIGKIAVPNKILNKPKGLDDDEYSIVKEHAALGKEILQEIDSLPEISLGAGYHHEKYDGTGYPEGLKGDEIPKIAQIISVADAFDAMYSTRPYRKSMKLEDCLEEIRKGEGVQFNPELAEAFIELVHDGWLEMEEPDKDVLWW